MPRDAEYLNNEKRRNPNCTTKKMHSMIKGLSCLTSLTCCICACHAEHVAGSPPGSTPAVLARAQAKLQNREDLMEFLGLIKKEDGIGGKDVITYC